MQLKIVYEFDLYHLYKNKLIIQCQLLCLTRSSLFKETDVKAYESIIHNKLRNIMVPAFEEQTEDERTIGLYCFSLFEMRQGKVVEQKFQLY